MPMPEAAQSAGRYIQRKGKPGLVTDVRYGSLVEISCACRTGVHSVPVTGSGILLPCRGLRSRRPTGHTLER